ncbi:MAG TPA: PA domain-containing protein, partial [Polyangiales bacterium]|nr:PA domain-containing protein [Polyangiales bacterium]
PSAAFARATVMIQIEEGDALSDMTPATPAGGNTGTTLGEQRKLALDYAAQVWGERLDSDVPITVGVSFEPLPCSGSASVLGAAATTALFTGVSGGGANPAFYYPSALANKLAGRDLDPSDPEIRMQLNSDVDAACKAGTGGFYYGFDGKGASGVDFIETVMHELAHGLGLASFADPETGELFTADGVDPYTALVRDLDLDQTWPSLTDAQRQMSAGDLRRVAWDGDRARAMTAEQFAKGVPSVTFEPTVAGFSGIVSDSSFGENSALHPAAGTLRAAPLGGCSSVSGVSGAVLLLRPTRCSVATAAQFAKDSGAAGALIVSSGSPFSAPAQPLDVEGDSVALPVVAISSSDADQINQALMAGAVQASLGGAADKLLGSDDAQRPLLFASRPVSASSTISHLEPLIRPQQLMEPITGPVPTHDVSFTLALLADVGWQLLCGNGVIDGSEECDDGAKNNDVLSDRCRSTCTKRRCGDGVKDPNEACDGNNDDSRANACRTSCQLPACGDGVIDNGEECDDGANNSDTGAGRCRMRCRKAMCGDGVIDPREECDDGTNNGSSSGACRSNCKAPSCGDGVVDPGEECDDGTTNSDMLAGACRASCEKAHCGDGIVDPGEDCDGSTGCSDECRRGGSASRNRSSDAGESESDAGESRDDHQASCSCGITAGARAPGALSLPFLLLGAARLRRRRRSKSKPD